MLCIIATLCFEILQEEIFSFMWSNSAAVVALKFCPVLYTDFRLCCCELCININSSKLTVNSFQSWDDINLQPFKFLLPAFCWWIVCEYAGVLKNCIIQWMKISCVFYLENVGWEQGRVHLLSETECEKYLPSRADFLMLGDKSDSVLYYGTHNSIFASS